MHSRYIHTETVHCQRVLLGGLPSMSLKTIGSWIHLWGGRVVKPLLSSLDASTLVYYDSLTSHHMTTVHGMMCLRTRLTTADGDGIFST